MMAAPARLWLGVCQGQECVKMTSMVFVDGQSTFTAGSE